MAQGKYGINYDEVFFPIVMFSSVRTCWCLQLKEKCYPSDGHCKDGDLKEEIYMRQPPGYVTPGKEKQMCKLKNPFID